MSKYDKTIEISREEEGTYHRREIEPVHYRYSGKPVTTYHTERYLVDDSNRSPSRADRRIVPVKSSSKSLAANYSSDEADNYEEWTTSKRKINHKTRQVETRVSRQLLVENGKVIADSGPQVTTRIKEDNRVEECEKEKTPKNKSKFEALENAPEGPEGSCFGRVLGEKKEIQKVSREVREENMQYHDERFKELTGRDVHQKAIKAPHELMALHDDKHHSSDSAPRGKIVHYSNKGKKYQDTDEILEVAKLAIDGSITKEVKRTNKHEEFSEDEKPDEKGEAEELRQKPVVQRSSRRHADYVNDYDDLRTPDTSDNDEREVYDSRGRLTASAAAPKHRTSSSSKHSHHHQAADKELRRHQHADDDDEAFPRYDLDPLLNSLQDEDYKKDNIPTTTTTSNGKSRHVKEHSLERQRYHPKTDSSDDEQDDAAYRRHKTDSYKTTSGGHVEIPEEYRVNRQRLLASKTGQKYHSPVRSHSKSSTHKQQSHGRNQQRKEDAAVQAHLTDEEIERESIRSSASGEAKTHAKATHHLQRQWTPNSSRRYYYGNAATANGKPHHADHRRGKTAGGSRRRNSVTSSSSASSMSSLDDLDQRRAKQRQQGTRSRDSGFKSPHSMSRTETPLSEHKRKEQQIYSVSSKAKKHCDDDGRDNVISPTLTTGSAGQRSVKTTTTTMSAGLADRPLSRQGTMDKSSKSGRKGTGDKTTRYHFGSAVHHHGEDEFSEREHATEGSQQIDKDDRVSFDTMSVSSLNGPNATKIKVPYRHVIEIQRVGHTNRGTANKQVTEKQEIEKRTQRQQEAKSSVAVEKSSSEMSFQEDIERLSNRLANINGENDRGQQDVADSNRKHYNYRTVMASIQSAPGQPQKQVINAYNARTLEQNSPFVQTNHEPETNQSGEQQDFSPSEYYVKYRATPALVDESTLLTGKKIHADNDDDDRMSQLSSSCCSLHSSRTYKIRTIRQNDIDGDRNNHDRMADSANGEQEQETVEFDENGNSKRPAAWIFDPRDGSSTIIVPPKRPETPKVDSKTEELVQSRGGRSYYLEILDNKNQQNQKKKANGNSSHSGKNRASSSMDSLYSRWNSQGALNMGTSPSLSSAGSQMKPFSYRPLTPAKTPTKSMHKSTKQLNSVIAQHEQNREKLDKQQQLTMSRRQLPFGGPPSTLGDKSKSSSCLLTVTKPSKYSIYGGFRKPDETDKPVPRLSYSRAIGPRSQRVDNLPKTPSRYLKMR